MIASDSHVGSTLYIPESDVSYRPSNESIEQYNVDKQYDLRFVQMQFSCLHLKLVFICLVCFNVHLMLSTTNCLTGVTVLKKKKFFVYKFVNIKMLYLTFLSVPDALYIIDTLLILTQCLQRYNRGIGGGNSRRVGESDCTRRG